MATAAPTTSSGALTREEETNGLSASWTVRKGRQEPGWLSF